MTARFIVADVFDGLATLETGSVEAGLTYVQIGRALGVSNATVWRNLNT